MKAPKKPKAIWEAKVPVEKENTVPEVNIFAVMEEVPEVHISVAAVAAYKGDREGVVSPGDYIQYARPSPPRLARVPRPLRRLPPSYAASRNLSFHTEDSFRTRHGQTAFHCLKSSGNPSLLTDHFSQNSLKTPTSFPPTQTILNYSLLIPRAFWIHMFYGIGITS